MTSQCQQSKSLSTYRQIKTHFHQEKYLNYIKNTGDRNALTAFRISAHSLEIERYRYAKNYIPRNERFCSLCTPDHRIHIGDEFHAMMICNKFKNCRDELFNLLSKECKLFDTMEMYTKFIYILTYEGPVMNQIAKFVREILSVKRDISV